jgi:SH3-like domain-containing protein
MVNCWRSRLIFGLILLAGCNTEPELSPVIDRAFVGPFELELLEELAPDSAIVATLEHGEPVDIIQRRRTFARLRTASGVEGWVDSRSLLSASGMARLRGLSMNAARLTSQGKATVYDRLNVHTSPNRQAPSFFQMQEGVLVEVLAHQVLPRRPYEPPADDADLIQPLNSYDPPSVDPAAGGPVDDWTLVRLRDGRAGWVLTGMLVLAIPDEVAQYAGGSRITSYASLGSVEDNGRTRHDWLWTTLSGGGKPYQFDSFRVFVWSLRRHRYETAYVARNVFGYFPVIVQLPESGAGGSEMVRFTVTVCEPDGQFFKRTYAFSGYRVNLVEETPWEAPSRSGAEYVQLPPQEAPSLFESLLARIKGIFGGGEDEEAEE